MNNTPALPTSQDVHREAISVLIEQLGITKAAIFLGETRWQPTDYLQLKQQLFAGETVSSLYEKVIHWREQQQHS
ncbi:MAG: hypothetical protein KME27_00735 [Lyngbya sp. HA4199-MV5]|jgi:hypothetical protein|nr:hypothetical protein [Lyngbya sp. HA4199-MV5]